MYNYVRNAYVGWKKGVPSELYWPCLWADTKCVLYSGMWIILSAPIALPLLALAGIGAGLTKFVEICASGLGAFGEVTGARQTMDRLNHNCFKKQNPVREWLRANNSMRYRKVESPNHE